MMSREEAVILFQQTLEGVFAAARSAPLHGINSLIGTSKRISWQFLLISAIIALVIFYVRRRRQGKHDLKGLFRAVVPPEIYLHPSSVQDYLWFFLSPFAYLPLVAMFGFLTPISSALTYKGMITVFGRPMPEAPTVAVSVAYSLLFLMAVDLGSYIAHWLMHRVPFLWEFHKTHHSAEVLNPLTAARLHPLERVMLGVWVSIVTGWVIGSFAYYYQPFTTTAKFMGINMFAFLTHTISGNLRHSHVWFAYPRFLEHIFSSPAQHQIHHSRRPEHFNKNLAVHFAFWDWIFGTLHVADKEPMDLDLGLDDGTEKEYRSQWALMTLPIKNNWRRLRGTA